MKTVYRYYCLYRPPMPGGVPRDGLERAICWDWPQSFNGVSSWGYVEYNRPLSDEEVGSYELFVSENNPLEY